MSEVLNFSNHEWLFKYGSDATNDVIFTALLDLIRPGVRVINLSHCGLTLRHVYPIFEKIAETPSVKELDLSNNMLTYSSSMGANVTRLFLKDLINKTHLNKLKLNYCGLTKEQKIDALSSICNDVEIEGSEDIIEKRNYHIRKILEEQKEFESDYNSSQAVSSIMSMRTTPIDDDDDDSSSIDSSIDSSSNEESIAELLSKMRDDSNRVSLEEAKDLLRRETKRVYDADRRMKIRQSKQAKTRAKQARQVTSLKKKLTKDEQQIQKDLREVQVVTSLKKKLTKDELQIQKDLREIQVMEDRFKRGRLR